MSATKTERLIRSIERSKTQCRIAKRHTPERLDAINASLTEMRIELLKTRQKVVQKAQKVER